jgi:predicted DNA-binding antitoxin AbrB/MazE fold protein
MTIGRNPEANMSIVHAIFENGVFRPTEKVLLPELCEVEFEPRVVGRDDIPKTGLAGVYEVLGRRFDSGEHDVAARHNEHQP